MSPRDESEYSAPGRVSAPRSPTELIPGELDCHHVSMPSMSEALRLLALGCLLLTVPVMAEHALLVSGNGSDLHAFTLSESGSLVAGAATPSGQNPSFCAFSPAGRAVYVIQERGDGAVRAYARDPASGALRDLNQVPSGGKGPCHVSLDPSGRWLFVAHYGSGHVTVFPVHTDGSIGAMSDRHQAGVNAHMAITDPSGKFVYVPCKGSDAIAQYRFDAENGRLLPLDPPMVATATGAGPRHIVFTADSSQAYVVNELNQTVTCYQVEAGCLQPGASISTLPADYTGANTTAHIVLSLDQRTLYASNRGHDSVAIFSRDGAGVLTVLGHVGPSEGLTTPRHFALSPDGHFLVVAAQDSDELLTYAVTTAGMLSLSSRTPCPGRPCCVVFSPSP